jgi:4-hydroxythreonine-4-phosphate dehydrogenase
LERAAAGCLDGTFAGVVTGPVNKERMAGVGFHFPGQTEFFAARAGLAADAVTMALVGSRLRVFLVSTHVPLRRALRLVTPRRLARTLAHARAHLAPGLRREPQLAVAAWNPHAGEGGHIGREEDEVVRPALAGAAALGGAWMARVPVLPADTVFVRAARGELDGVVCLYHDQGLIPFKLLHFTDGVNITLGLPFVRTSPDHGTAYELAGTGRADARSMEAALRLAARLVARRDAIGIVQ